MAAKLLRRRRADSIRARREKNILFDKQAGYMCAIDPRLPSTESSCNREESIYALK